MQPEQDFKKIVWRSIIDSGQSTELYTIWSIGGVAVIVGLLITNLESISKIVPVEGIKISIILFVLSLLAGAISKQVGMAVSSGVNTLREMESLLESKAGQELVSQIKAEPTELVRDFSRPFIWPMSIMVCRAAEKGIEDQLTEDKRFIKMFSLQIIFNMIHNLLALGAILSIGLFIS